MAENLIRGLVNKIDEAVENKCPVRLLRMSDKPRNEVAENSKKLILSVWSKWDNWRQD